MYTLNEKCKLITETSPMSHVTVSVYTVQTIIFFRHIRTHIQDSRYKISMTSKGIVS